MNNMKNLKSEIKKIFLGYIEDNELDKLLSLFKQQMKGLVMKKQEKDNYCQIDNEENPYCGHNYCLRLIEKQRGFNEAIDQLLKNIESL